MCNCGIEDKTRFWIYKYAFASGDTNTIASDIYGQGVRRAHDRAFLLKANDRAIFLKTLRLTPTRAATALGYRKK